MNRLVLFSLLAVTSVAQVVAQAPFSGMKYRIPRDANTLILINADKMFGSTVADIEQWNEKRREAYNSGLLALPPDGKEVLIAGRMDTELGDTIWELAMIKLNAERNVTTVAARYGGSMDEIEGRSAARLPNDHYVVQLKGDLLASHVPANRQDVSRWLRITDVGSGDNLPPYLSTAFDYANKVRTPIVMALDLNGAISATEAKSHLDRMEFVTNAGVDTEQAAKLLSGIQGITLGVTTLDRAAGAIRVDFSESPEALREVGKDLLLRVLERQGAMVDDFYDWKLSIQGNTLMLNGPLKIDGTRRLLSVLELPRTLSDSMHEATSPGVDQEGKNKLLATQQYWNSVNTLLDDLRIKPKRDKVKTFGQAAMWYDKYARKIDRLPIMNVDREMLDYGSTIAASLRNAEMSMKGVGMRVSNRTMSNTQRSGGYYSGTFGGYRAGMGYHGGLYGATGYSVSMMPGQAALQEQGRTNAIIRTQERSAGAATVQEIWRQMDDAQSQMRRQMTEKYSAEF